MPMYEYACRDCGHRFEKLAKSFDAQATAKPECPSCGSAQTGRELSVFAVGAEGAKASSAPTGGGCACGGPGPCGMN